MEEVVSCMRPLLLCIHGVPRHVHSCCDGMAVPHAQVQLLVLLADCAGRVYAWVGVRGLRSAGARDWVAELQGGSVYCVDTSKTYTCWEVHAPALITVPQQFVPSGTDGTTSSTFSEVCKLNAIG